MSMTKKARSGSISQRHGFADPDQYQNVTDPQQGNRTEGMNKRMKSDGRRKWKGRRQEEEWQEEEWQEGNKSSTLGS
jgi:hypothetical protein